MSSVPVHTAVWPATASPVGRGVHESAVASCPASRTKPAASKAALFGSFEPMMPPAATALAFAACKAEVTAPGASCEEPTAPVAIFALVIAPSCTVFAIMA